MSLAGPCGPVETSARVGAATLPGLLPFVTNRYNYLRAHADLSPQRTALSNLAHAPVNPNPTQGATITVSGQNERGHRREYEMAYEGVIPNLERRYKETDSDYMRMEIERYMSSKPCTVCNGQRLKPESLAVTITGKNIVQVTRMSVVEALHWVEELQGRGATGVPPLTQREQTIAEQALAYQQASNQWERQREAYLRQREQENQRAADHKRDATPGTRKHDEPPKDTRADNSATPRAPIETNAELVSDVTQ